MFDRLRSGVRSSFASCVALPLVACMLMTGCTPQQKQTTLQVITEVNVHGPELVAAADTAAATIAALDPAEAALIGISDTAFDTAAKTVQALTASYIANPNASTLAQIQASITTLEGQINSATLNAVGIKDVAKQQMVLAALKGLLTIVTVVFARVAPTMTTSQLIDLRDSHTIHLAKVRRYMDEPELQRQARAMHVDLNRSFAQAEAFGF